MKNAKENLNHLMKENMGNRRQQGKINKIKNQNTWRIEMGGNHNIHDFQFWEEDTLDRLDQKRMYDFDDWTEEDTRLRNRLMDNNFKDINKREFTAFVNGCAKYGRNEYELISKDLAMEMKEVKRYSMHFWKH